MVIPLYITFCFVNAAFNILFNFFHFNYSVLWCGSLGLILFETLWFLDSDVHFPSWVREVFSYYVFRYVIWGTSWVALVTNSPASARDTGSIPGSGSSPGEGNGSTLQYSCLENPVDRGNWWAVVPGVTKNRTRPSNWTQMFSALFFLSFPSGTCIMHMWLCLMLFQRSLKLSSFLFILFFCSSSVISTTVFWLADSFLCII